MYGKPSPQGSGNGWSGWYKGWFFRSLLELSFMINVIERFNFTWESAEKKKFIIKYINWKNIERTYRADFFIENKYLVEIKPINLQQGDEVIRKAEAAKKWCKKNKLIYKLTSCSKQINVEKLKKLINDNKINLTKRYQEKLAKYE